MSGVWELVAGAFLLAILFMLVRPGSPAGQAVNDLSDALASLISTATGIHPASKGNPGDFVNLHPGTLNGI